MYQMISKNKKSQLRLTVPQKPSNYSQTNKGSAKRCQMVPSKRQRLPKCIKGALKPSMVPTQPHNRPPKTTKGSRKLGKGSRKGESES